jgi:uncharacterized RDD family membrane protein YckC
VRDRCLARAARGAGSGGGLGGGILGAFLGVLLFLAVTLGYIWIFIDHRKRGWHDLIAGTVVVQTRS